MTRRSYLKILVMLFLVLFAICLFIPNKVHATTSEEAQKALDLIPNEIYLDIPEIEYEKANDLVKEQIFKIWIDNGIDITKINNNLSLLGIDIWSLDRFYSAEVSIGIDNGTLSKKTINIKYSNTDNKNTEYEQYIKNLKLESFKYLEVNLDSYKDKELEEILENYYSNIINDNSIILKSRIGSAAGNIIGTQIDTFCLCFFKNGNLYDIKSFEPVDIIPYLIVPSSMTEDEIKEYIYNEVGKYYPEYISSIESVEKGAAVEDMNLNYPNIYKNMDNVYTIVTKKEIPNNLIIIKKLDDILQLKDKSTNIKLETTTAVVPTGTTLTAEKVTKGDNYNTVVKAVEKDVSKFVLYDINLVNNNSKIQPNGKVKVSIPVPEGYDTRKIVVYRVAEDGTKTKYDTTITDGYITFETDHFSNYVVAEKTTSTENNNTNTTETKPGNTNTDRELDDTPKTGEETNVVSIISFILSIVSALGLAVVKKF